ncbi:MAG: L-glutamate gamma-semialdehyde dehydrogenase [Sphingomonadales bacterium]|nr:L-glutamate gamma-semialdehyde dehydrogenase [Sphingomonadales bacterium]
MSYGIFTPPHARNEAVRSYAPGSSESLALQQKIQEFRSQSIDIPMFIGGKEVRTGKTRRLAPPHDHAHTLGYYHEGDASHVTQAIVAALKARNEWERLPWEQRAGVFLRMAELLAGPYRDILNASTMLGQSKNPFQAEIDSACELIDFFRFNVQYMTEIYRQQPKSSPGTWNRLEYRALEGFVFALTPFNFTSIAGNLPTAPALMGNTVVWKPSNTQIYSAYWLMQLFREAGLPDGVINLVYVSGPVAGDVIFRHPDFTGIHFTGSTVVFQDIWKSIGNNIQYYKSYPRIVGETGGKDFVLAHRSARVDVLATALSRGAFEYQGQKCSAASRAYIPESIWPVVKDRILADLADMKMGGVEDFTNFINAVIDEKSFDKLTAQIEQARQDGQEIVAGGGYDKSKGYFIEPTIIRANDPKYVTLCEELFGPILTVYVYPDNQYEEILELCDQTSPYALTGAVIAQDRYALDLATERLRHSAGNFYINDKPTGAVVGQQPFGGARGSGTNDKAGFSLNLLRWVSVRTIKENLVPPVSYRYPFQG